MTTNTEIRGPGIPRWAYIGGVVAAAIVVFLIITRPGNDDGGRDHTTAYVTRGPMEVTVTGAGSIRAARSVKINVPEDVRGELQLIYMIPEGTQVQPGDIVAMLDTTSAVQRLETALDQLETAEASYEQLLSDHVNNIKDLENAVRSADLSYQQAELRLENLQFNSRLSQQQGELDLENARISLNEANRKLEAQKVINEMDRRSSYRSLVRQRDEVEGIRAEMEALVIHAPTSGMVIHTEEGRWMDRTKVREGDSVRRHQEIMEIPDLSLLQVEIRINELDAELIRIGQPVRIRMEAYPRLELPGHVTDISTLAQEFSSNVRVFPAVITLDTPTDPRAKPGMTASADIVVDTQQDVLQAPLSAIGVMNGRMYVKPHDTHEPVEVVLGVRNESVAEVLEGVELGEELDLGWLQDESTVLYMLAGQSRVPEQVAQSIIAEGDRYGEVSPVREFPGMEEMMQVTGQRGGRGGGIDFQAIDPSQITPEQMELLNEMVTRGGTEQGGRQGGGFQRGGAGSDSTRGGRFGGRRGAESDSARAARTALMIEQIRQRIDSLPDSLRSEVSAFIEGGAMDYRSLSPALMDSLRAWGVMGRGRQSRTPPPDEGKVDFEGEIL